MPFDGFGNFLRLYSWVVDATNSVKIRADRHDAEDNNFTAGLSNCITKDGQSIISQNTPWNSRRITALADPVDPQDAATRAYADTKMPLDGSAPITGDVTIKNDDPTITLDGKPGSPNAIYGQKSDKNRWAIVLGNSSPETGSNAGSDFNLLNYADDGSQLGSALDGIRASGLLSVKANPIAALGIATKQYVDTADNTKLPLTGGTITGNLQVSGEIGGAANIFRFGAIGSSSGYIQWQGGGSYVLGGAGTIWHSGNFNPAALGTVSDVRLAIAGDFQPVGNNLNEPFQGAVVSNVTINVATGGTWVRLRYLQINKGSGFVTVGYA